MEILSTRRRIMKRIKRACKCEETLMSLQMSGKKSGWHVKVEEASRNLKEFYTILEWYYLAFNLKKEKKETRASECSKGKTRLKTKKN